MIKVIIIDDETKSIGRMKRMLAMLEDVEIVASVNNAAKAVEVITKHHPDIVFLDIEMPGMSGIEIVRSLRASSCFPGIIFVTAFEQYAIKAIKEGVFDYLLKPVDMDELKQAMDSFRARPASRAHIVFEDADKLFSPNELEIINHISCGLNSKEIGEKMYLSPHTIDTYRRHILEKADCRNAAELVRYAMLSGII